VIFFLTSFTVCILQEDSIAREDGALAGRRQGVIFINILHTEISYERRFSSYVLALLKNLYEKRARITLMKLTTGVIFINSFTRRFFNKSALHKLSRHTVWLCNFLTKRTSAQKVLVKCW